MTPGSLHDRPAGRSCGATIDYFNASTEIIVDAPPTLTLPDAATLCAENPVTLTAIDGYDPTEGLYNFRMDKCCRTSIW